MFLAFKFDWLSVRTAHGTVILWQYAQSTCTWTCHKRHFMRKFIGKRPQTKSKSFSRRMFCASLRGRNAHGHLTRAIYAEIYRENAAPQSEHLDQALALINSYRTNPSVWTHCLGKNANYFTLSDPRHDIFCHSFWHLIWMYIWYTYIIYICVYYIYIDIIQACYSGILFDVPFWHSFWYLFWHPIWHPFWHLFRQFFSSILIGILSDILSSIYSDILSGIYSDITFWHSILTFFLTWAPDLIGHRPLRSDLRSWGSAVPTEIWSWNEEGGRRKKGRKKEGNNSEKI